MVDILPVRVRCLRVGVGYGVGVLLLAVVMAGGREGVGLGLDFGNSKNGVGHGAVGEGLGRRLSFMPFLPRGEQGGSAPQENELPRRDHGLNLREGRVADPPSSSNHSELWLCFSRGGKVRIFTLSSPCLPEADLVGRGITQEGIR